MADPTIFSYTFLDTNGVKATARAYTAYNGAVETIDALIGEWLALGALYDAATNAQITGGRIQIPVLPGGGWKATPVEENDVSDVIVMDFSNTSNRYVHEVLMPNFKQAQLVAGQVDLTETALAALIAHLIAGGTNINYTNTAGQDLASLSHAFQSDRKHRRDLRNKSIARP